MATRPVPTPSDLPEPPEFAELDVVAEEAGDELPPGMPPGPPPDEPEGAELTLGEHLNEIRQRLTVAVLTMVLTTVLAVLNEIYPPEAYVPESTPGSPLETYLNTDETVFPVWPSNDALGPKTSVLGLQAGGEAKAYTVGVLQERRVVNDEVGGTPVVIVASSETEAARVYERGTLSLSLGDGEETGTPPEVVDEDGGVWKVTEEALVNEESGQELPRIPAQIALWMSWYAFFPDTGLEK